MTINTNAIGVLFQYNTTYDLSSNTELTLKFTSPTNVETILTKTAGRVSAPATPSAGGAPANTYMQITQELTDFTEVGTWAVCGIYNDGTPKQLPGNDATFLVEEGC